MAVNGINGATPTKVVPSDKTGFNALTSNDFLKLLVTQLQNQDPTEPVGNEELLGQLSQMRSLQSNIELGDAMKAITTNQTLSTAASFIGKSVVGSDAAGKSVSGTVDGAYMANGSAFVRIGGASIPLANVTDVSLAS